jgi:hypothetical protein
MLQQTIVLWMGERSSCTVVVAIVLACFYARPRARTGVTVFGSRQTIQLPATNENTIDKHLKSSQLCLVNDRK